MVKNIGTSFNYIEKIMMRKIITTMIWSKLKYARTVWSPHKRKHVHKLERIQKMATKLDPELAGLQYQGRIREINLPAFYF